MAKQDREKRWRNRGHNQDVINIEWLDGIGKRGGGIVGIT